MLGLMNHGFYFAYIFQIAFFSLIFSVINSEDAYGQEQKTLVAADLNHLWSEQLRSCNSKDPIIIDVGHSFDKPGPTDPFGRTEFSFNKYFVEKLKNSLLGISGGREVLLIGINGEASEITEHLPTRNDIPSHAGVYLSIHHDLVDANIALDTLGFYKKDDQLFAPGHPTISGWTLYTSRRTGANALSILAAQNLASVLLSHGIPDSRASAWYIQDDQRILIDGNRNIYRFDDLYVLRHQQRTSVLLEIGFLNSPTDLSNLYDPKFVERTAKAVAIGLMLFPCAREGLSAQPNTTIPWDEFSALRPIPPTPRQRSFSN